MVSLGDLELPGESLAFLGLCGPVQGSAGSCFVLSDRAHWLDPFSTFTHICPSLAPGPGLVREQPFLHPWGTPIGYCLSCPLAGSRNESRKWACG